MATPTIAEVMAAIETRLLTIGAKLRVDDLKPGQINPPPGGGTAVVGVPAIPRYHASMARGHMDIAFTITVFVSPAVDRVGQLALAAFANPTGDLSIPAVIYADRTLGGVVQDSFVEDFRPLGLEEVGVIGYWGGVFTLPVIHRGS